MIFSRKWRMERIEQQIAGKKAKLAATRELVNLCDMSVPGALVLSMTTLPQEIAELETKAKQLMASNVKVTGAPPTDASKGDDA